MDMNPITEDRHQVEGYDTFKGKARETLPNTGIKPQYRKANVLSYMEVDFNKLGEDQLLSTEISSQEDESDYEGFEKSQMAATTVGFWKANDSKIRQERYNATLFDRKKHLKVKEKRVRSINKFRDTNIASPSQQWVTDKEFEKAQNPSYDKREKNRLNWDRQMLEKRRHGRVLKNIALEQDMVVNNRRLDRDLKAKIF